MWFKINETEVRISFTVFAVLIFGLVSSDYLIFIYTFVTALIHESIHLLFIKLFGNRIYEITVSIFGATIKREGTFQNNNFNEAMINLSAPIFNIIFGFILNALGILAVFSTINIATGFFNLLPFYTFDGGKGLFAFISNYFSNRFCEIILTVTSMIITAFFTILAVFSFLGAEKNPSFLIVSLYMILSVLSGVFSKNNNFA